MGPQPCRLCLAGPPAFGLSGVMPALLRLAVVDMGYLGRHTGSMIALSTVGSLAGTWGTAFFFSRGWGPRRSWHVGVIQLPVGLIGCSRGAERHHGLRGLA